MAKRDSERIRVARCVDDPGELLDRHVPEGADYRGIRRRSEIACRPEIDERDPTVGLPDQICRLDVTMEDHRRQTLEIDQNLQHLPGNVDGFFLDERVFG